MQLQMDGDKATLAFASQHAAVRDALESALPRLREMFAQNGLDIVDVNVSQQNTPGREEQQAAGGRSTAASGEAETDGDQQFLQSGVTTSAAGMVDYYV
jgi:flagellar hook-length control protein FliK